jgi:ribonuclease R
MSKRRPKKGPAKFRGRSPKKTAARGGGGGSGGGQGRNGGRRGGGGGERGGKVLRGRVQKNPKGFAFIVPLHAEFEDAFVPREEAAQLLNGDTVEFAMQKRGARASARILKIVERRSSRVIGKVTPAGHGMALVTSNNEYFDLQGDPAGVRAGDWVVAELQQAPDANRPGTAEVTESFGKFLTPKNDIAFTIARYGLPDHFSEGLLRDGEKYRAMAQEEIDDPAENRRDQRNLPYVTIDGEDAKDFDDAIYVERNAKGFILYVAIADVSFFVRPGTQLDKEAHGRATSVYFPGFCLPMLPEFLSNELCSLRPQEDKLALTCEIHFTNAGTVETAKMYSSLIKTARRLTYAQVQAYHDKDPQMTKELLPLGTPLRDAFALYAKLDDQRKQRGVLDFDLPESKIVVDKDGKPTSVAKAPRYLSHKLIEEFMIAANRAVAKHLREVKSPALYRVHEQPDASKLDDLNQLLKNLGMPGRITEVSPRAFAEVLKNTAEIKSAATVHQVILRLQKQAKYMPEPKGHFGLALNDYAHFTSPIRRYPDLVVHRALKGLTGRPGKSDKRSEGTASDDFARLGEHTSEMERRATEAERFIVRRKQCWYFLDRVGDTFDGTVCGLSKNGVFVNLGEMAAEGFMPIEYLDGFWEHDERQMCLRKRPAPGLISLGDAIRVQIVKVTVEENQITLGTPETKLAKAPDKK